jgi:WD40 repeat protein
MENEITQINNRNLTDTMNKDFELSHIIGLNTKLREPVQSHPLMNETIIYSVGGIVITEDLSEKNNQVFFRHGSQDISCFKISNTGRFLAVGFTRGEQNFDKKLPVSIILWDYQNKEILYELTGLFKAVTSITFSNDDKFISALSQENSFFIWEVDTGIKCYSRIYEHKIDLIYWTAILSGTNTSGRSDYTITITSVNGLIYLHLFFELKSMQYNTRQSKFTLPSTGLVRYFTCALYDSSVNALYLGTSGGEICVFSIDNLIFKMSFNAINNGVTSILLLRDENCLIVGGGDGRVKKIARDGFNSNDLKHSVIQEIQFNARISSMSMMSDFREVICSLANGFVYRILIRDLSYSLHSIAHLNNVNDICFMNQPRQIQVEHENISTSKSPQTSINDKCFTVDDYGSLYIWDLNDFEVRGMLQGDSGAKCLAWGDDGIN